jgi:hypothetical protein
MMNTRPKITRFYHFTDPGTAKKIAAVGFESAGVWSHEGMVNITDRPPAALGGAVLRVGLPPEAAAAVLTYEEQAPPSGYRTFAVPIVLLRHAYIDIVDEAAE